MSTSASGAGTDPSTDERGDPSGGGGGGSGTVARVRDPGAIAAFHASRWPLAGFFVIVALGAGALAATTLEAVPATVGRGGAALIATAYAWALAARTGGRPYVFGLLAAALAGVVLTVESMLLTAGAAALTCVVTAILAVMATVPAARIRRAVGEALFAMGVAVIGAFATVGWDPELDLVTFEYVTLALALVGTFAVVHRLGAGWHGLGRRGLLLVLAGALILGLVLAYAEVLRRYGTPELVGGVLGANDWLRENAGGAPLPLPSLLGIPALVWGTHMRARRRQGWWVCAFGVTATVRTAQALVQADTSLVDEAVSLGYSVVVGVLLGWLLVRLDLRLRGPRGVMARREEEKHATRPEPRRWRALL